MVFYNHGDIDVIYDVEDLDASRLQTDMLDDLVVKWFIIQQPSGNQRDISLF